MKNILSKGQLSILIVLGILILDQVIKIEVKTNMFYNESIHITDWFYLRFIENPGMAFGMQIVPKAIQTIARTIFAIAIGWYIVILIKAKYKRGYIACISLILAGAIWAMRRTTVHYILWRYFQQEYTHRDFYFRTYRGRIYRLAAWKSGRYVLLSSF